ncbi:MAG: hypothetical protein E7316_02265 [Clostridiales bacterium]|nr:hypothetical protein [Clostridiales bacterium]
MATETKKKTDLEREKEEQAKQANRERTMASVGQYAASKSDYERRKEAKEGLRTAKAKQANRERTMTSVGKYVASKSEYERRKEAKEGLRTAKVKQETENRSGANQAAVEAPATKIHNTQPKAAAKTQQPWIPKINTAQKTSTEKEQPVTQQTSTGKEQPAQEQPKMTWAEKVKAYNAPVGDELNGYIAKSQEVLDRRRSFVSAQTKIGLAKDAAEKKKAESGKPVLPDTSGPATPEQTQAVAGWYDENSEEARRAKWDEARGAYSQAETEYENYLGMSESLDEVEAAYAARAAGQELTKRQQWLLTYGQTPSREEINAALEKNKAIMDENAWAVEGGYGSMQNERAERYKGKASELVMAVENSAAEMIDQGRMGEWSLYWQYSWDQTESQLKELKADLNVLKTSGAKKRTIEEVEERIGWLEADLQALTDLSVMANADFAVMSQRDMSITDEDYLEVNGERLQTSKMPEYAANAMQRQARYKTLTDLERAIYNYKYKMEGPESAKAYKYKVLDLRSQYRKTMQDDENLRELAEEAPVGSSIISVLQSPMQSLGGLYAGTSALIGADANPYRDEFDATRSINTVRGTVEENIDSNLGKFAYKTATGIGDNLMSSAASGGKSTLAAGIMGLSGMGAKSMEMLESGATAREAGIGGGITMATEFITEKIQFDNVFDAFISGKSAGTYGDMLKTAAKSFFSGGMEETSSGLVEEAVDRYLMGENSNRVQTIKANMDKGMGMNDAIREADWSFVQSLGETFLVGGASESVMATGGYALGAQTARAQAEEITRELPGLDKELVQTALEMQHGVREMDEAVVEEAYAQIEAEQEKQVEQQNHAVFKAPAVMGGEQVVVAGVDTSGAEAKVNVIKDGVETAVPLNEVEFATEEQRQAYGYATSYADADVARRFLAGYEKSNAPISNYAKGFAAEYAAGRNNRELIGTENVWAKALPDQIQQLAYEAGQKSAAKETTQLQMDEDVSSAVAKTVTALPTEVTESHTGAVNLVTRSKLTSSQATQMAVLDQVGRKYGTQYIIVDSFQDQTEGMEQLGVAASVQNGKLNGVYKYGTNQMVIALDAEGGNLLRAAGHESWHYIKEHSQSNNYVRGDAEALQNFVLEKLQATEGYDLETRIAEKQDQYKRLAGQELDRDAAIEEIVADSMVEVLATEENVRDLMENHTTLGEKVLGFIKRFLNNIRTMLRNMGGKNAEARAMLEQTEETLQQIAEHFNRVMIEVNAVRESGSAAQSDGGVKYSLSGEDSEVEHIKDQIRAKLDILNRMEPVANISAPNMEKENKTNRIRWAIDMLKPYGGRVDRQGFGKIEIGRNQIDMSIEYLKTPGDIAAVLAVPRVLKRGVEIQRHKGHKERPYDTVTFAAPVVINGVKGNVGVVVKLLGRNLYKTHRIVMPDGSAFTFEDNEKSREDTRGRNSSQERGANTRNNSAKNSIADETKKGKNKFSLSDDDYQKAVAANDMNAAQRMVDEAAEKQFRESKIRGKNGKLLKVYHGTKADFNVFDTSKQGGVNGTAEGYGIYLSDSQSVTSAYGQRQIGAYANITKPATSWKKTLTLPQLTKLIEATCKAEAKRMMEDDGYDTMKDALPDTWISNYVETYRSPSMSAHYRSAASQLLQMNDNDMDIIQEVMVAMGIRDYATAENFYEKMLTPTTGIDGFWTTWDNQNTGEKSNVILALKSSQVKYADPATYDDNGELIPLSKRFDTSESDIRYSLKDVDTFNPEMEVLLEENRELRDLVRGLNTKLKEYSGRAMDEKTVRRVASGLKKKYSSTVPLSTLTENMSRAFAAMQQATDTRQSEAAMEMMGNIAMDMIVKSQVADREAYDSSKDLRERFRKHRIGLTDTQWQEAENIYGTARDFRRAVFGKWNVPAQNGRGVTTLDMVWDELVAEYPQYFTEDASEGDMVQQVIDMLHRTEIKYDNPFSADIGQVASGLATEIYQEYLKAEDYSGAKDPTVDRLLDQLADARATIMEQKHGMRNAARRVEEMREKRVSEAYRRKQNQDYKQVKGEIIRKKGQLLKKLETPKSGAFIPQSMHNAVLELLRAVDFEGKLEGGTNRPLTAAMLNRAQEEYTKLNLPDENGGTGPLAAFYNGDLVYDFELLARDADGKKAGELNMKEMQALRNIISGYAAAIVNEDRMFMQNRRESLQETGDDLLTTMHMRREHTVQGPVREWFSKGLQQGLIKPVTAFHQFKGTAMEPVWKALRNAEGQHIRHVEEAANYLEEALDKYDQHESIRKEGTKSKRDKAQEITFESGARMKLTDQEMMTLYATARREQMVGTQHLTAGGFTLANAAKGSSMRPVILTAKDIQTITNSLTQQQREYVDHMVEYLSGTCADWGNEVTLELYGVEKFHEEYYIPFSVNKNYVKVEPATAQDSRIKTGSFTKALTDKASNPLEIKPFTEIWCQHVEKMSDYNAFVLPIEDMTRLMNYKGEGEGVKAVMNRAYGKQTTDYIMNFLRRLNGNSRNEMGESWLGGFMSRAKGAAVTFNLSVAIQQMGSASRAMAMIDPKYFMLGSMKAAFHGKSDGHRSFNASYAEMEKYAPIAVEKGWGYFDTNMSQGMYQRAQNTTRNKINDAGGKLAEVGDKMTWARIWEAVKAETADTHPDVKVGSEEFFQLCAERATDVIDNTQVVDSIFQRAEWAAEKGMMKNFMAFMSEPLSTYNMVYRALWDIGEAKGKGRAAMTRALKTTGRTVGSIVVSSAVTAALKSVITALRDRDNEKKDEEGNIVGVRTGWDKWLDAMPGAFADNILGIGTIYTNAISDALSSFGGGSDLTTGWIGNLITGGKYMTQIISGEKESTLENWEKAMYKMLQGSSSALGIGFGNLWRDVKSAGMAVYEYVERESLAGSAWDKELPFETRLQAAQKNYVYAKQPGDKRKQNTDIYYDLMLTAYFEDGGMYENYEAAANAAIATGATSKGLTTGFKTRLRAAEELIPKAAAALVEGNMDAYNEAVTTLQEKGIGMRAISSMVISEAKELLPQEETEPGTGADVAGELQRTDVDDDPVKFMMNQEYNAAATPEELKAAVDQMRENGTTDKDLRTKVTTSYRKAYCEAIWNGDTQTAREAAAMMRGAGVGITDDDLHEWTSGLSGSYASDQLHKLIKDGDGKSAVKIRAAMYKAHGQQETNAAIESYVKKYCVGKENVDEAKVKKAMLALGYSQQTIDSWFKK